MTGNISQNASLPSQRWSPFVETADGKFWFQQVDLPEDEARSLARSQAEQLRAGGLVVTRVGIQTEDC